MCSICDRKQKGGFHCLICGPDTFAVPATPVEFVTAVAAAPAGNPVTCAAPAVVHFLLVAAAGAAATEDEVFVVDAAAAADDDDNCPNLPAAAAALEVVLPSMTKNMLNQYLILGHG